MIVPEKALFVKETRRITFQNQEFCTQYLILKVIQNFTSICDFCIIYLLIHKNKLRRYYVRKFSEQSRKKVKKAPPF